MALRTLKSREDSLPDSVFVRVHRQSIINLHHVTTIVRAEDEDVRFQFAGPLRDISASRRRVSELRNRLAEAGLTQLLP
ncbi:MAG: LytTR family transcriptional regulator DNA-binding domain-containing protein [Candidatus Synoicihabitans palmerolidicus]|nr:LytTR family transcriptional regulator DNA-binding domain-containing protein [Candidatus Synoicihabitans palmerolidicus]